MGRELRRVTADWQHPKDESGDWIPMHEWFPYDEDRLVREIGEGRLDPSKPMYGLRVMPICPFWERMHVQYYESTTEGTPISPVCATVEELAVWCHQHAPKASGMSYDSGLMGGLSREDWTVYLQGEWQLWYRRARNSMPLQELALSRRIGFR